MDSQFKTLTRYEVASLIAELKPEILQIWELRCRARIAAAQVQSRSDLRDSLPQFIDMLVDTLRGNPVSQTRAPAKVAREHAEERVNQPEYTLDEVISEFHILRTTVLEQVENGAPVEREARKIINAFIDAGISNSASKYMEIEISRRAHYAQMMEEARIEAERGSQAKSAFLANMSHEIRTPLGAIMGFAGLLKDQGLPRDEIADYVSIIERSSYHLLRIIDDILDLTKVEAGKMIIEKIEFSLVEFLADFASISAIKAREHSIEFEFVAETTLPEFVSTDPTRMRQILSNVIGNAIKFTDKGRVKLAVSFKNNCLNCRISDTGRGISSEQRGALFQAFSQADSSTTRKYGGTGIGLVITKKLCQALGGDFTLVESEVGKGSVFEATVAIALPPHASMVPLKKVDSSFSIDPIHMNLKGLEILLIEDSPDNQYLVQKMLGKTGALITVADDGAAGVKIALARRFDVILCDIQMPVMDGHEACRTLRAKGYHVPIVALTAHAMNEEKERAAQSGFSHFLTKPIDRKSLNNLLGLIYSSVPEHI